MKFLIAASFLCIALVGQAQGGSLRGLSVVKPHEQYGVPLLQTEEIKPEIAIPIVELPKQEEPITSKPFSDHLPLIDSAVNFGYPSGKPSASFNEPVTQKPEFLSLLPGLPSLPNAPIFPINAERPIQVTQELANNLLPPRPALPHLQPGLPILQAAPVIVPIVPVGLNYQEYVSFASPVNFSPFQPSAPLVPLPISKPIQIAQQPSNAYLPPQPQLPVLQPGLPSLPEAPKVPLVVEKPIEAHAELSNSYLPPQPELPLLQPGIPSLPEAPKVPVTIAPEQPIQPPQPELPLLQPGLPALPEAPQVPVTVTPQPPQPELPLLQPGLPALPEAPQVPPTIAPEQPIQPPQPELPLLQPGLPALPEAPRVPLTIAIEQPIETHAELSNTYLPPKPELPLLQPGLPSLPEAPKVPFVVEQPFEAHAELSNSISPPKPELPLLQPGLPSLPEAPKVPLIVEQPFEAHAELSNNISPPKPELPLLQPGLPSLPEVPKVPLNIVIEQPTPQPQLPAPQPTEAPVIPFDVEKPFSIYLVEKQNPGLSPFLLPVSGIPPQPQPNVEIELPKITEIPALPEAPVVPASPQIVDESKDGYSYNKPTSAFIETVQLPFVSQAPIVNQPLSQIQIVPGSISSQILGVSQASYIQPAQLIPIQPSLTAQQNLPQQSVPEVNKAPVEAAAHHGYDYSPPTKDFLIPYQY